MISEAGSVKVIGFVIDAVLRSDAGRGQRRVTGGEVMNAHESDVVNLAGLLYAALVGRWPGSEGSSIPDAPSEHDRPLRPRQVRAGVPRPLDAICERVLNAGAHPHMLPIESAHEIYAALSDYIGDPGTAVGGQVAGATTGTEPTSLLDRDDLPGSALGAAAGAAAGAADGAADGDDPLPVEDTSDLPATGELSQPGWSTAATPAAEPDVDPEATQAGTPMFFDEGGGVGWLSTSDRSSLPDAGEQHEDHASRDRALPAAAASRPPAPPEQPERPLFAEGPSAAAAAAARARHDPAPRSWAASPEKDDDSFIGSFRGTTNHRSSSGRTAAGHPVVPPRWGPDADEPPPADPASWDDDREEVPGRSWLRLAVVLAVVLLLVLGVVFAFGLGRGPGEPRRQPQPDPRALQRRPGERQAADHRGHRLRPAGRPAGGEPRPRPARRRRQARHRVADADLPRQPPARWSQERRRAARGPRQAGRGGPGEAHAARQRDLAGPARRPGRHPGRPHQHRRPHDGRVGEGRGHHGRPSSRRRRSPRGGWWSG